ncbi:hypothetical protein Q5N41_18270 [Vibrio cholerae]|uniref:inorganic phosphate transporter n=1 Tax=Vibrio cholerae TaxID=666 RepID=UPI0011DAE130|nr:inorganic phosphate transporter [Vibrio cholerae]MDV2380303.1 hypothetical protein [Vibrio cholerae]TXY79074.1 inorganic phosphate transporter [Vibrio cholerae]TXZ93803.1 inorganic phosphate transporter [Vibrio cholerae]BCI77633.1 hypothetical protein VCSRO102_2892 [Vibrio cholerae]GHX73006.1 hypothetical protein VCSRO16_3599 [Vibrio cholerae]
MDKELITAIAKDIINEAIFDNYHMYMLVIAISVLSAILSSLFTSYFKKRGEHLATKADLEDIVAHLEATTLAAEKIKADIAKDVQEKLDKKVLFREKLETIFSHTFELEVWLEKSRSEAIRKNSPNVNESPLYKLEMYQAIYFPDVNDELRDLQDSYYPMLRFIFSIAQGKTGISKGEVEEFAEVYDPFLKNLKNFRVALLEKYSAQAGL